MAIFGGFVGIIFFFRKDKINVILGVVIVMVLMLLFCVIGFGVVEVFEFWIWKGSMEL